MVSPINLTKPSACLRHQLRDVIFGHRCRPRADAQEFHFTRFSRGIAATSSHYEESSTSLADQKLPKIWKVNNGLGRIVGKPGRRQRVVSAHLKTNSLDRPSNVVILKDVKDEGNSSDVGRGTVALGSNTLATRKGSRRPITAEEIEKYVGIRRSTPQEEEVNASIESLKPTSAVIDATEFASLRDKLCQSYTYQQLYRFVSTSFESFDIDQPALDKSASERNTRELRSSKWQPGRTPIDARHTREAITVRRKSKAIIVDRLLRSGWKITVLSEEQAIGEIDLALKSWQITFLQLVGPGDRLNYQRILPQFLIDASEIQSHRPNNILRITARRQDAEEILERIKLALKSVHRFDFDFNVFQKILAARGRPEPLDWLKNRTERAYFSRVTGSVMMSEGDGIVRVYSFTEAEQNMAKRLLLATLEIPPSRSFDKTHTEASASKEGEHDATVHGISYSPWLCLGGSTNRHYENLSLVRAVKPESQAEIMRSNPPSLEHSNAKEAGGNPSAELGALVADVVKQLNSVKPLLSRDVEGQALPGYDLVSTGWFTEFCHILHSHMPPKDSPKNSNSIETSEGLHKPEELSKALKANPVIVYPSVSGFETLATYLVPEQGTKVSSSEVVVRMIPSPPEPSGQQSSTALPHVEIRFRKIVNGKMEVVELKIILDEQVLKVPLPTETIDIQFKRQLHMIRNRSDLVNDKYILCLESNLGNYMKPNTDPVSVEAEMKIRLPARLVDRGTRNKAELEPEHDEYMEVPYLIERFDIIQTRRLRTNVDYESQIYREGADQIFQNVPKDTVLTYQDIDGGSVASAYSSLRLTLSEPMPRNGEETDLPLQAECVESTSESTLSEVNPTSPVSSQMLVRASLGVSELLTRAAAGSLPLHHQPAERNAARTF